MNLVNVWQLMVPCDVVKDLGILHKLSIKVNIDVEFKQHLPDLLNYKGRGLVPLKTWESPLIIYKASLFVCKWL